MLLHMHVNTSFYTTRTGLDKVHKTKHSDYLALLNASDLLIQIILCSEIQRLPHPLKCI